MGAWWMRVWILVLMAGWWEGCVALLKGALFNVPLALVGTDCD